MTHPNTLKLREAMDSRSMTAREVSWLLNCEPNTVRVWRTLTTTRVIPDMKLDYLLLKLQARDADKAGK